MPYLLRSYTAKRSRSYDLSSHPNIKRGKTEGLHEVGYQIFRGAIEITPEILDSVRTAIDGGTRKIFNHNESGKRNDNKRRQRNLTVRTRCMQSFDQRLKQFVREHVNTELTPANPVILHSLPGCQPQAAHCDYEPDETLRAASDAQMPLALVVSLMPGTRLNIWPNSSRLALATHLDAKEFEPICREEAELAPGDIIVFRGDFVHAGSGYEAANSRIHYYLDSPVVPRAQNRTWLIEKHGSDALRALIVRKDAAVGPPALRL